jgi:hypothetical protein
MMPKSSGKDTTLHHLAFVDLALRFNSNFPASHVTTRYIGNPTIIQVG